MLYTRPPSSFILFLFLAAAAAALHRYIYLDCTVTTAEWCRRRVFGFFCCPFIHWNSAAAGGISSRISFFFSSMESSEVRTVQTACRNETELEGGSNVQKGTDHTHKRIDEAIRRRLYIEEKGWSNDLLARRRTLCLLFFSPNQQEIWECRCLCPSSSHSLLLGCQSVSVFVLLY
jgi:hypothetical protein